MAMTPTFIGIFLGCCFLLDILATYFYICHIRKKYPKLDYKEFELNAILGFCWSKFGFEKGTLIGVIVMSPFWLMVLGGALFDERYFYMFLGMYMVIFIIHYANWIIIWTKQETNFSKIYKKLYGGDAR